MNWRRWFAIGRLILFFILFIGVVAPEWPAFQDETRLLETIVELRQFDFVRWGAGALESKIAEVAAGSDTFLQQDTRSDVVLSYLRWVSDVRRLSNEINGIYADALVEDPEAASRSLQAELAAARLEMERLQPLAEAVLQEQVAAVLVEEGFGALGGVWPPVAMHMTPLPQILIVSPRDEIRQIYNVPLTPGITIPQQEALEQRVFDELDRSALVVPIGGLGFYPAMIIETGNVNFLADTVAHEWAHHWLTFLPLGIRYFASPQLRTINETAASIVGTEVGAKVVQRFYPQFAPPDTGEDARDEEQDDAEDGQEGTDEPRPTPFDFRAEMSETRVEVDRLLASGKVQEAEAYMEQRRQMFVANGYPIRKLNQAYFAFYGAYADTPGASGGDPVGPAVLALRKQSDSLHSFMLTIGRVTNFETLQEIVGP